MSILTEKEQTTLELASEASKLCGHLATRIINLVDVKQYAEQTHDLDTFTDCHFEIERCSRLWQKADKRFNRRVSRIE